MVSVRESSSLLYPSAVFFPLVFLDKPVHVQTKFRFSETPGILGPFIVFHIHVLIPDIPTNLSLGGRHLGQAEDLPFS